MSLWVGLAMLMVWLTSSAAALAGRRAPELEQALTAEERDWLTAHPRARVAFDPQFPPYSLRNEQGDWEGLAVDLVSSLARRINLELVLWEGDSWEELYAAALGGEVDVVATMVRRTEREEAFEFTAPYISKSLVIMTRKDDARIASAEDLSGKSIALVKEYQYVPQVLQEHPSARPVFVQTMLDGLNAVSTGAADSTMTYFGAGHYLQAKYHLPNLRFALIYDRDTAKECLAVRKDWPLLRSVLDKALTTFPSAERQALRRQWLDDEALAGVHTALRLTAEEKAWIAKHPVVHVGVDPEFHPFEFIDEQGVYQGIASDFLKLLGPRLGIRFDITHGLTWSQAVERARRRELDLLPAVGMTQERQSFLEYTEPYVEFQRVIISRNDLPFLSGLDDLESLKVAVQAESSHEGFLEENTETNPITYPTLDETLLAVSTGKADVMVGNVASATYRIRKLSLANLKVAASAGSEPQGIHFAVRKDWPELVGVLQKGVASLTVREREAISKKWVVLQVDPEVQHGPLLLTALGALLVLGLILLWNRQLSRHRNRARKAHQAAEEARRQAERANEELRRLSADLEKLVEERSAELHQSQARFYRAQRLEALGTLVGGIAHDFNNVLAAMLGAIELAHADAENEEQRATLSVASEVGFRGADLITQLLAFARQQQAGKVTLDVGQLMDGVRALARPALPETIELEINVESGDLWVRGNLALLQQVLLNLLTNARDAVEGRERPRVTLRAHVLRPNAALRASHPELEGVDYVAFEVADNGRGIEEEQLAKSFDPFFTTKDPGRGTGLGLPMVYGAVRDHGGAVWGESQPGHGTTFFVLLPRLRDLEVEEELPDVVTHGSGETLLLAEDEPSLREMHRRQLTRIGYKVVTANDGLQAMRAFERHAVTVDLALLDVVMPGRDGVAVAEAIRRARPDVAVLFLTGYDPGRAVKWSQDQARTAILKKPCSLATLSQALKALLSSASARARE